MRNINERAANRGLGTEPHVQYVWTTDANGTIDYCNRHFLEFCGLTLAQVQAGKVLECVHPDDLAALLAKMEGSRATGQPFEHEYRVRRAADGEYRWHLASAELFTDAEGRRRGVGVGIDITSQKQMELDLRAANARLDGILSSISESFLVLDREWRFQYVSQRVLGQTGKNWSELRGEIIWELFPEAAQTGFKGGCETVMRDRVPLTFDVEDPLADGSAQSYQAHAYPTPDGIAVLISNVTEKRKTENALTESKRLLQIVLNAAGVGTWLWDPRSNAVIDLGNTARLHGLERVASFEDFRGVLHPGDGAAIDLALDAARTTGRLQSEYRIVCPEATVRTLRAIGSLLPGGPGQPETFAGVVLDISDQSRAEEVRNRLAAIVDSSDDAIVSKDLDGIVTSWNAGAKHLFGYRSEEIVGKSILTIIPPELHSEEPRILEKLRNGEKIDHYETERIRKDGSRVQVSLTISPVRDAGGRIVGASKIARDISERLRMQEAIIQSEKLAATGRMAAAIAHEINNPLEAVTNLAYLLSTDPTLSLPGRNYTELLLDEINRVSQVAKQSLGFFRDSKKPSAFDICELLEAVATLYKPMLDHRGIRLIRNFSGPCPVFGSSSEIRQVFANLVRNAIEALDKNGVIELRSRATPSGMQHILVADNGRGIPQETMKRLFQPFASSKGTAGNGLGLWVSKGIVEKHGGKIHARTCTVPGRTGTVFAVILPAWGTLEQVAATEHIAERLAS